MDHHLHGSHGQDREGDGLLSRGSSASGSCDDENDATWMENGAQRKEKKTNSIFWQLAMVLIGVIVVDAIFIYVALTRIVRGEDATLVYCKSLSVPSGSLSISEMLTSGPTNPAPANEAVRPEVVLFQGELGAVNDFKGHPSTEMDKAWSSLYEGKCLRCSAIFPFLCRDMLTRSTLCRIIVKPLAVSSDELERANASSFEIPTRPGKHLVKLAVFHQLHCVACHSPSNN